MKTSLKQAVRTCSQGHRYYKSSDCPTCPIYEEIRQPKDGFLALVSAPARRALENAKIKTLDQLSEYSEKELLKLHGIGKTAIPILKTSLINAGLTFKD